jgi:hypothetical protein
VAAKIKKTVLFYKNGSDRLDCKYTDAGYWMLDAASRQRVKN